MRVIVALDGPHADRVAGELRTAGHEVLLVLPTAAVAREAGVPGTRLQEALPAADALVVAAVRGVLSQTLVGACDRHAVRIVALATRPAQERLARAFGLAGPLPLDADGAEIAAAAAGAIPAHAPSPAGRIIVVWGPAGAPGRTTVATELAAALGTGGRRAALVDADTHAPAVAVALGLEEESPGIAAACRRAASGDVDAAELTRISVPLGTPGIDVDVLTGLNRPSRWPELSAPRLAAVLDACRSWAENVVVDIAAPLERDEEIVSDLDGPRRNAAALAALEQADLVIAVASADPVGMARFVRAHAELRALVGAVPVQVVVNRLRTGALGIDARGQVRRTLERFSGVGDVAFVPHDPRAADAALLAARPVAEVAPRSALAQGIRRLAARLDAPAGGRAARPERAQEPVVARRRRRQAA